VAGWVTAADVLAIVSRVEPLGVAALEALAAGRPVVATRVGGTREVVPDPGAGRGVDPADPWAIARAILAVLADPPSPEACRAAAEPHGIDVQAGKVDAILRRATLRGR
jgi:glycosyltransferase involved in cell wall biosynthesis